MNYHIDTGLIIQEFNKDSECPICSIGKIAEEQFLHEFLNDSVMASETREKVNKLGFCSHHFDKLFNRQNKLSLGLQISTRVYQLQDYIVPIKNKKQAKKQAELLRKQSSTCIVCDLLNESMIKYYKTIAQLYAKENSFRQTFKNCKGFCLEHYAYLLEYSMFAGTFADEYIQVLSELQARNISRLQQDLTRFCRKHDYRNASMPLGSAEFVLPNMRIKLYGDKGK